MKEREPWSEEEKRFRLRTVLVAAARDGLAIEAREQAAAERGTRTDILQVPLQDDTVHDPRIDGEIPTS